MVTKTYLINLTTNNFKYFYLKQWIMLYDHLKRFNLNCDLDQHVRRGHHSVDGRAEELLTLLWRGM